MLIGSQCHTHTHTLSLSLSLFTLLLFVAVVAVVVAVVVCSLTHLLRHSPAHFHSLVILFGLYLLGNT
ncbi:hypothetical protein BKA57DRAFT_455149, partial [Linnemannia elongata]